MAIHPGDSRLPLYLNGTVQPVWRKYSPSKNVGLSLLHRDYWSNFAAKMERQNSCEILDPPECESRENWKPGFRPDHNGIIEGIAHVSPRMLKHQTKVYAEVEARYRMECSELDEYDIENNDIVFSQRALLCLVLCYKDRHYFKFPPNNLTIYSPELRQLYGKLAEVPPKTTECSDLPDLSSTTYNFPFRFDINRGPDSITISSNKRAAISGRPRPKNRQELYFEAIYGFHDEVDSDFEPPSESDDEDSLPRIRHPREPIKTPRIIRKVNIKKQTFKDCFHADSYPWRHRKKTCPKAGIYWTMRVYALHQGEIKPEVKNQAELRIRRLTYLPISTPLQFHPPPQIYTDYSLAIGPRANTDGGVITLAAQLDKVFYRTGDPIKVNIKIHNSSCRVIQQITVEVIQCVRIMNILDRVWRSVMCKREITAENDSAEMPILPSTEKLRLQCRLNPWPVESQYMHLFKDKLHKRRSPKVPVEAEAFTLIAPVEAGSLYGIQQPARYEHFPQNFVDKRKPAFTTLGGIIDSMIATENSTGKSDDSLEKKPYDHCRCIKRKPKEADSPQCMNEEPYQYPIPDQDCVVGNKQWKYQTAVQQMLTPLCRLCRRNVEIKEQPVSVNYEVVVSAVLRPQNLPDPLAQDVLLEASSFGKGLSLPPKGEIIGTRGPRVTLPLIFSISEPEKQTIVPMSNFNVDREPELPPKSAPKPQPWKPCDGKGFFLIREPKKIAPCYNVGQNTMPDQE
ncbi:hypothetical protein Aperf_G00000003960 [Anoplocephala perfoliata]